MVLEESSSSDERIISPTMAASLSAHEITYILSCLPRRVAARFKTVCRAWKDVMSTPYFRSLQVQRPASDVLGFFSLGVWSCDLWLTPTDNSKQHVGGCNGQIVVLAVCDGLLLVRTKYGQQCHVWNPSNQSSVCLPWHWGGRNHSHHGLAKGSSPNSFEIVSINNENQGWWHSCSIYSSITGTSRECRWGYWSERMNVGTLLNLVGGACAGRTTVHFLTDDGKRILAVDVRGRQCKRIDLPGGVRMLEEGLWGQKNVWLASVDDDLYLVFASGRTIQLWVLLAAAEEEEEEEEQWEMVLEFPCPLAMTSVFFDGHRIGVVDIEDWGKGEKRWISFYDTRNRRWEGAPHLLPSNLTLEWPTLFPFIKDITIVGK